MPAPPASAATEPAIRSITVRPAQPVVGAHGSVRLVIDVIARGVKGKDGVTVKVEPGAPPAGATPQPRPATPPAIEPQNPATPGTTQQPDAIQQPDTPPAQPPVEDEPQQTTEPAPQGTADEAAQDGTAQGSTGQGSTGQGTTQQGTTQQGTPQTPAAQGETGETAQTGAPATVIAPGREPYRPRHILTYAYAGEQQHRLQGARPEAQQATAQQPAQNAQPAPIGAVVAPKVSVRPQNKAQVAEAVPPRLVWRRIPVPPARMAGGWETWRFLPDKRLNRYYPAGTWTITATAKGRDGKTVTRYASFQLRRESRLSSVRVEKAAKGDGVRLRGSLTRVDPRGLTDYGPFAKQRLDILWRPDENSAWEKVGQATTDASGAFVQTVQGRTGGHWRVRFAGTGHYSPDNSKVQQIAR